MHKKIFIDCGTHYGEGLRQFIDMYKMDAEWEIHTFEANPVAHAHFLNRNGELLQHYNIKHYNLAISDSYGKIRLNQETPPNEDNSGMGTSIISLNQWNPWGGELALNFKTFVDVDTIAFSDFLDKTVSIGDFCVIKMDIEGAEYQTLEKIISRGLYNKMNDIFVEYHSNFFVDKQKMFEWERDITNKLRSENVNLVLWH